MAAKKFQSMEQKGTMKRQVSNVQKGQRYSKSGFAPKKHGNNKPGKYHYSQGAM